MKRLLIGLVCAACGCGSDSRETQPEPAPKRRVIEPPSGAVKMLAPHPITAEGVGPYKLRKAVAPLLDRSQGGPLNLRFEIPNVLHTGLARTEQGGLLIGSELPAGSGTTITFLAVISAKVGTLSSGLRVGSTTDEVLKAGLAAGDAERAYDPRLSIPAVAPNARLVIDRKRVAAIVLAGEAREPRDSRDDCARPASTETAFGACMTTGELIEIDGDDLIIRLPDQEKPFARTPVPNLMFAVPLRNAADGRDELVAIARSEDSATRTWMMVAFRFENGQLKRAVDPTPLYQLSSTQTRWIGAELKDLDLYLDLTSRGDAIEVGGLLTATRGGEIHDVVPISPVLVARKHHKPATPEATDAGVPDAELPNGPGERSQGSRAR